MQLSGFARIELIEDYGLFEWDPTLNPSSVSSVPTAEAILACLVSVDGSVKPPAMLPVSELQSKIRAAEGGIKLRRDLEPESMKMEYPIACPRVGPLHVAERRGLDLTTVDFLVSGSFLFACAKEIANDGAAGPGQVVGNGSGAEEQSVEATASATPEETQLRRLASLKPLLGRRRKKSSAAVAATTDGSSTPKKPVYLAQNCKGLTVISKAVPDYAEDRSAPTYQFKRFVCGRDLRERHGSKSLEHLRLLQVTCDDAKKTTLRLLISATVDGVSSRKGLRPVKVRSVPVTDQNALELLLQMVSCGADKLLSGTSKGGKLTGVSEHSIDQMWKRVLENQKLHADLQRLEDNIGRALLALKKLPLEEDRTYEVVPPDSSRNSALDLRPVTSPSRQLLPPRRVIEELWLSAVLPAAVARMFVSMGMVSTFSGIKSLLHKAIGFKRASSSGAALETKSKAEKHDHQSKEEDGESSSASSSKEDILDDPQDDDMVTVRDVMSCYGSVVSARSCAEKSAYSFRSFASASSHSATSLAVSHNSLSSGFASAHSAESHLTASSLGMDHPSRSRKEDIRKLTSAIPELYDLAGHKSDVHYYRTLFFDGDFERWDLRLPKALRNLLEVPIQKEKEFRREGTGCFVGFLHFATNNIRHVGQDKGDMLLEDALEFLAVRAGRQRKDMEFRSKAFRSSFVSCLIDAFGDLPNIVHHVRTEGNAWTARLGRDAIALMGLAEDPSERGNSRVHRLVDSGRLSAVREALGTLSPEHILWRNADGESALDRAERLAAARFLPELFDTNGSDVGLAKNFEETVEIFRLLQSRVLEDVEKNCGYERGDALRRGRTLLHRAVDQEHVDVVEVLLKEVGVDPRWRCDVSGITAGQLAALRVAVADRSEEVLTQATTTGSTWSTTGSEDGEEESLPSPTSLERARSGESAGHSVRARRGSARRVFSSKERLLRICAMLGVEVVDPDLLDQGIGSAAALECRLGAGRVRPPSEASSRRSSLLGSEDFNSVCGSLADLQDVLEDHPIMDAGEQ